MVEVFLIVLAAFTLILARMIRNLTSRLDSLQDRVGSHSHSNAITSTHFGPFNGTVPSWTYSTKQFGED